VPGYGLHIGVVFPEPPGYLFFLMKLPLLLAAIFCWFTAVMLPLRAAEGRVIKVLPHFLDTNLIHTLGPSLYERDAYQAYLRLHPEKRSGIRFDVQWKTRSPVFGTLKLRVELRGIAQANLPRQTVLERNVDPSKWFSRWTSLQLIGHEYQDFGEVTAWRVTLWKDNELLSEQKSFLW
jgi:hypothetical protein